MKIFRQRTVAQCFGVSAGALGFAIVRKRGAAAFQLLFRCLLRCQGRNGYRGRRVPVQVEGSGNLPHHRPDGEDVEVRKVEVRLCLEVFVSDVAAADDRSLPIRDEGFVVHAPVHAFEIGNHAEQPGIARSDGIEQPHFDIRMGIDQQQMLVVRVCTEIVDQQAHAHAAIGCAKQMFQQQAAGDVVVPDVVLHVQAALRGLGQHEACDEGIHAARQRVGA